MAKLFMVFILFLMITLQLLDQSIVRTLTAKKEVEAVYVSSNSVSPMVIETQEVVNNESIEKFAKDAVVTLFNYRPGQSQEHMEQEHIKDLFINEMHYERFVEQFVAWSMHEFSVNNISIKESVVSGGELIMPPSPMSSGGVRLWQYKASLPMLDRGVGDNALSSMKIVIRMVYLGSSGGIGIYSVNLSS